MKAKNLTIWLLVFFFTAVGCGGGSSPHKQFTGEENPMENPDGSGGSGSDGTESETLDTITLSVSVTIEDDDTASFSSLIKAVSIANQVSRVYIEVIIDETVYSTTDLAQDEDDSLVYTGNIVIPVDVALTLHAVAESSDGTVLFEGTATGITASEYGTPAIELNLQRQIETGDTEVNTAPVIQAVYVGDQSLAYGESTNISVEAEDPQDDVLTYLWEVTSAPDGADTSSSLSNADQQWATFTAPSVEGLYTVQVTVTDDEGAMDTEDLVIYASETGLDDSPEVEVILSDFPDSARLSTFSPDYISSNEVDDISITNTQPGSTSLTTSFRYITDEGTTTYTASELYSLGMNFQWTDTCSGNNFIETAGDGNQSAAESSTQVAPSFYKTNLSEETCQITLQLTNADGLSDTYQFVLNYTDDNNNDSDELNCDDDPGSTSPKVAITCPDEMTSVPATITVEACDAQGDLSYAYGFNIDYYSIWTWYTSSVGTTLYAKLSTYAYDYGDSSLYAYLSGSSDSTTILFVPYYASSTSASDIQSTYGGDLFTYFYSLDQEDIITPIGGYAKISVYDTGGHSSSAYCTFPIAEGIDLNIP